MTSARASGRWKADTAESSTAIADNKGLNWDEAWNGWLRSRRCGCFSCKGQEARYLAVLRAENPTAVELAIQLSSD